MGHIDGHGPWSTGVTNSAFLLANVSTPIDSAYSMHMHAPLCSLLMRTTMNNIMTGKDRQY